MQTASPTIAAAAMIAMMLMVVISYYVNGDVLNTQSFGMICSDGPAARKRFTKLDIELESVTFPVMVLVVVIGVLPL